MSDWIEIHALADGQLEGEAKANAEAQLAANPRLRAEFEAVQSLKSALSRVEPVTDANVWQKCRGRMDELEKRQKVEGFVGRYAWGLCGIFVAVILSAGVLNRMGGAEMRTSDVAKMLSGFSTSSGTQANQGVPMGNWIERSGNRDALRVMGSFPISFEGYPATVYHLADDKGKLSYLSVRGITRIEGVEPMLENRSFSIAKINDVNCVVWPQSGGMHFLVGNRPYEELAEKAESLRE